MTSTTAVSAPARQAAGRHAPIALAVLFWLAVWQFAAWGVGRDYLLAGPVAVVVRLAELIVTVSFWETIGTSLARIAAGFAAAVVVGTVGAALAARFRVADALTAPLVVTARSVPVVSFIILVLLWVQAAWLAAITSFLIVVPLMHTTLLAGIRQRDPQLLEASAVFRMPWWRRVRAIDVPAVTPYFVAACSTGIGLAWKAGVAAEVIGVAHGSIGEQLYEAKLFLASADVFAWTIAIVALSLACQSVVLWAVQRGRAWLAGGVA